MARLQAGPALASVWRLRLPQPACGPGLPWQEHVGRIFHGWCVGHGGCGRHAGCGWCVGHVCCGPLPSTCCLRPWFLECSVGGEEASGLGRKSEFLLPITNPWVWWSPGVQSEADRLVLHKERQCVRPKAGWARLPPAVQQPCPGRSPELDPIPSPVRGSREGEGPSQGGARTPVLLWAEPGSAGSVLQAWSQSPAIFLQSWEEGESRHFELLGHEEPNK